MRMHSLSRLGLVGAALSAIQVEASSAAEAMRHFSSAYGWGPSNTVRRSKNAPTKRKLKANRNHISRRVRRKHRRAA